MISLIPFDPNTHRQDVLSIFSSRPDIFPLNEIDQISEETNFPSTNHHFKLVAMVDSHVSGYIGAILDSSSKFWYLDWFAVGNQFQKMGIGTQLVNEVFSYLKSIKVSKVQVQTCSCNGEAPARSFYIRHGFTQVNVEKDGYAPHHSKITYSKSL